MSDRADAREARDGQVEDLEVRGDEARDIAGGAAKKPMGKAAKKSAAGKAQGRRLYGKEA
jgi:hypothetical protein